MTTPRYTSPFPCCYCHTLVQPADVDAEGFAHRFCARRREQFMRASRTRW